MKKFFFIICLCLSLPVLISAQDTAISNNDYIPFKPVIKNIDTTGWAKQTKDIDYNEKAKKQTNPFNFDLHDLTFLGNLKYVVIILVVLLLVFVIYFTIRNERRNKKDKGELNWNEIEDIKEINNDVLASELAKALADKNFRLALRLEFLIILKRLVAFDLIKWKKEKTNTDYKYELSNHPISTYFTQAAYIFDRVWYGEVKADEEEYQKIKSLSNEMFSLLDNNINVNAKAPQ